MDWVINFQKLNISFQGCNSELYQLCISKLIKTYTWTMYTQGYISHVSLNAYTISNIKEAMTENK